MAGFTPASRAPLVGVAYMCVTAIVLFPALNASVKFLVVADYHIVQIIWFRCVFHMAVMLLLFTPTMGRSLFATSRPGLQMVRSATQLAAFGCYWTALVYIPITTATAIAFTGPLIVVGLSVPFLGERVGPRRWAAVAVGFAGALVIIRPGADVAHWATVVVLGGAFFYAVFQIQTRLIAGHDDPRTTAVYTIVVALVVTTIAVPFYWTTPAGITDWLVFVALGGFGGLGHFFVIKAYERAEASIIGPFDYGQLIGATILGYAIFAEFPDSWTWVGAAVIVASGLYVAHREARLARARR